jgi:hypothetical protein
MSHTLIASNPPSYDMWLTVAVMYKDGKEIPFINDSLISGHAEVTWIAEQIPLFPVYRETLSRPPLFSNPLYCVDMTAKNNNCDLIRALNILWNEAYIYAQEDVTPPIKVDEKLPEIDRTCLLKTEGFKSEEMETILDMLTVYLDCTSVIINKQLVWSKRRLDYIYFISCQLSTGGAIALSGVYERIKDQLDVLIAEADTIETQNKKFDDNILF